MSEPGRFTALKHRLHLLWIDGWIKGIAMILGVCGLLLALIIANVPDKHVNDGFEIADVTATIDATDDMGFDLLIHVRLSNGSNHSLRTRSLALASEARDQICLERRRTASAQIHYKIAQWHKCQPD